MALQLSCTLLPLSHHGLRDPTMSILAVRLIVFTESKLQYRPFLENARRVCAARHRSPERAATRRGCPGAAGHDMNSPARLPDRFTVHFLFSIASTASSNRGVAAPPLPTKLRRRLAHSPPQNRRLHLAQSSAVSSSTSSPF